MMKANDCRCEGQWCMCHGHRVLKDGRSHRAALMMRDGFPAHSGSLPVADSVDPSEAAYRAMCNDLASAHVQTQGDRTTTDRKEMRDHLRAEEASVRAQAFSDAKGAGLDDAAAEAEAAYQAMKFRDANAWQTSARG